MKNEEVLVWDTTKFSSDYPKFIKNIYYKCSLKNRKHFSSWIGKANSKFLKDLDWWSASPVSRNPYVSELFHHVCIIETIKELNKSNINFDLTVGSNHLKIIIENILKKKNYKIHIKNKSNFLNKYINILKSIFFTLFVFSVVRIFTVKKQLNLIKKKKILIDTFVFNDIKKGNRLYKEGDKIIHSKNVKHIFFVPTITPQKNLIKIFSNIIFLNKKKYIFKEHYLNLKDLLFAFFHFARTRKFLVNYKKYKNLDLSRLIIDEIYLCKDYYSIVISLLNFSFARALKNENIQIKKVINWFENQTVDKGWNYGFRKFHPNVQTVGYQGFFYYGQYLNQTPSETEDKAKVIPRKIFVNSKIFVKLRKEFYKKANIKVGPTLSYQLSSLNKKFIKKEDIEVLLILNGIFKLDKKLIDSASKILSLHKNLFITIKPHPILPISKIDKKFLIKYRSRIHVSSERLDNLLKKTKISICSGPTSACLESIAYKCFLLCPVFEIYDKINLDIFKIPKNNYKLIYDIEDFSNTLISLINKKKLYLKTKKIILEKTTDAKIKKFIN